MGVPSHYFVLTQLQLWLFCCWGCGCCWAVTIKQAYNDILTSNYHLYLKRKLKQPSPELHLKNIVIFHKDNDLFYWVVTGIQGDQVAITCRGVEYTRPKSEIYHVASSSNK